MASSVSLKIADDEDFKRLKHMVEVDDDWLLEYDKTGVRVWSQHLCADEASKMIRVICHFPNFNPADLYDVIHDPDYRKVWDHSMIESVDIGHLNPNNDLCYYAVSCPPPMKNRDFVLQRSWLDTGDEQLIINHSVLHKDYPQRSGRVRAHSLFTGYLIRQSPNGGCTLGYVTQSNLQGDLPSWLVNKGTKILAPKYVRQLEQAALGYSKWKLRNTPNLKPWHFPEQITSPKLALYQGANTSIIPQKKLNGEMPIASPLASKVIDTVAGDQLSLSPTLRGDRRGSDAESTSRKKQLLSCLNFTKHCVGRNTDGDLP